MTRRWITGPAPAPAGSPPGRSERWRSPFRLRRSVVTACANSLRSVYLSYALDLSLRLSRLAMSLAVSASTYVRSSSVHVPVMISLRSFLSSGGGASAARARKLEPDNASRAARSADRRREADMRMASVQRGAAGGGVLARGGWRCQRRVPSAGREMTGVKQTCLSVAPDVL